MAANAKSSKARSLAGRVRRRLSGPSTADLLRRIERLEESVEENRRLNQRLSEVLDVMVEVLVPAVDRDEERLTELLATIDSTR
jgi:hypothetical protein